MNALVGHAALLLLIVDFVRLNPGFAAWLIGGLCLIIGTLVGAFFGLVFQRLGKLEERMEEVEKDILEIKDEANKEIAELRQENADAHSKIGEHLARMDEKLNHAVCPVSMESGKILALLQAMVASSAKE